MWTGSISETGTCSLLPQTRGSTHRIWVTVSKIHSGAFHTVCKVLSSARSSTLRNFCLTEIHPRPGHLHSLPSLGTHSSRCRAISKAVPHTHHQELRGGISGSVWAPTTYLSPGAWLWLSLPALCLLLVICGMFALIWELSQLSFWFLRHRWGGLFLFLLWRKGQGLEVVAPWFGFGVCVVQQQMLLLLVFDHFPVNMNSPKPRPGERGRIFVTFK